MMNRFSAMILLGACGLFAGDAAPKIVVTHTQHLDLPTGGQLKFKHSTGEIRIEAWDQPGVELTTMKSMKGDYYASEREKVSSMLDKVDVKAERQGEDLVITTVFPRHRFYPPATPLGSGVDFDLEYDLKVPRNARLDIDHNTGEVHVDGVLGEIHVESKQGLIALHLPEDRPYEIHAKSGLGAVNSDFPGDEKHTFFAGHRFTADKPGAAQKLFLHLHYGDIVILRTRVPAPPPSVR